MCENNRYFYEKLSESAKLHEAIIYATQAHKGQYRKGTQTDYICHPMEVLQILTEMRADNNLMIAGVLHDVVEDTGKKMLEIESLFGTDVAHLVKGHTENKSLEWKERKSGLVKKLEKGDIRLKKLVLADKVSNLRSIDSDIRLIGNKVWDKFSVGKNEEYWYYTSMKNALSELAADEDAKAVYDEMMELYNGVFENEAGRQQ